MGLSWKNIAKQEIKDEELYYNRIDKVCSNMRNGETHGLLIGPHASNLLAEIILTVVDKELYDKATAMLEILMTTTAMLAAVMRHNDFYRILNKSFANLICL